MLTIRCFKFITVVKETVEETLTNFKIDNFINMLLYEIWHSKRIHQSIFLIKNFKYHKNIFLWKKL